MIRKLLLFFLVGAVIGVIVFSLRSPGVSPVDPDAPASSEERVGTAITASRENAIVQAVERVSDAVVTVATITEQSHSPFGRGDFFRRFFRSREPVPGMGSGVMVDSMGMVLTNEHVVRNALRIEIVLPDGRFFVARVLGRAIDYDLAVLQIQCEDSLRFAAAPLGDSEDLIVGEWVIAIGNPLGYQLTDHKPSATVGVVSALEREVKGETESGAIYKNMIQTDAAINPGNSGGALVNAMGEVIGINTFILSTTGGSMGLGFAIPIHIARRIIDDIVEYGRVREVWIGLGVWNINHQYVAHRLGIANRNGLLVMAVDPGSPADRAGVEMYDIIRGVNRRPVRTDRDARREIFGAAPGDRLALQIERDGRLQEISFILEEKPTP